MASARLHAGVRALGGSGVASLRASASGAGASPANHYFRVSRNTNGMLKPQDVLVLLKLTTLWPNEWTYASLSESVGLSLSETHAAIQRATKARLFSEVARTAVQPELGLFLIYGADHVYFAERGAPTSRGMQTGFAAPGLDGADGYPENDLLVWPDPDGTDQGRVVEPLYRSAPVAAKRDPALYILLAAVDELRVGRARERVRAEHIIREALC